MTIHRQLICLLMAMTCLVVFQPINAAININDIQQAIHELDLYKQAQQQAGIQNPEIAYAMRKALVLAELMIDGDGQLDLPAIPLVKQYFIPSQPLEYEVNMDRFLDQLDASWQTFLDNVVKPHHPENISNLILRSLFGLQPLDVITDRHAKVAVLSALLAPLNQGPVGDCFAMADLIRDHAQYYMHSAKDYAELIEYGYLTRQVSDQADNFFFLPVIADTDINNLIAIDSSGIIRGTNASLFNTPGMAAACCIMGWNGVENFSNDVLNVLFQGNDADEVQVTAASIIQTFGSIAAKAISGTDQAVLTLQGLYAFSCLTNHPILRSAECAFAAMAESRTQDYLRSNINDCVNNALDSLWQSLGDQSKTFQDTFGANLNSLYRFVYNPSIPLAQIASDGSSSDGGFQLYKRILEQPGLIGIQVKTPEDFKQLVLDAIALTSTQRGTAQAHAIADQLIQFVQNGTFVRDALWAYDPANQNEPDPVQNYQILSRTPMQNCTGDNPYEVDDIDTGSTFENNVQTITPNNTRELINWCLNLAKKAPADFLPMNNTLHAFNFMPVNPDMSAFTKSGLSSNVFITQAVCVPGVKIATRIIDASTQAALTNTMYNVIKIALPDDRLYNLLVNILARQSMTIQKYAQALLKGINDLLFSDTAQTNLVAMILDNALLQALPANDRATLEQTALRFAFTNWNDGTKNIYFCAYYNPRTADLSFGCIDEDKHNLQPMDEQEWVYQQEWDVDLSPYVPKTLIAIGQ